MILYTCGFRTNTNHEEEKKEYNLIAQPKGKRSDKRPIPDKRKIKVVEQPCPYLERFEEYNPMNTTLEGVFI